MSPRADPFSSGNHDVELISISRMGDEDGSQVHSDKIKKIQQSFGVVSIPDLRAGDKWYCKLEIKWHKPKSVMLYASLGYSPNSTEAARINVHRSLQIKGKISISITHTFMMPFRREPLLLSKVKSLSGADQNVYLPLNETSILIVTARNSSEVPLRVKSMMIQSNSNKNETSYSIQHVGGVSADDSLLVPGGEFKGVFSVRPKIDSPNLELGSVWLCWKRDLTLSDSEDSGAVMEHKLPAVIVEPPLGVSNQTNLLQEIKYSLGDTQSFVFCGPHDNAGFILPKTEYVMSYKLVPLCSGSQQLPQATITSLRYSAALNPSVTATTIFVYPSEPKFFVADNEKETILAK